jgi:hypothetical protein
MALQLLLLSAAACRQNAETIQSSSSVSLFVL